MDDALRHHLDTVVRRVRSRLALRRAVRGVAWGLQVGLLLGALTVAVVRLAVPAEQAWLVGGLSVLVVLALAMLAGLGFGMLQKGLSRSEIAQLLDHTLGTEEAWITASWLVDADPHPNQLALTKSLQAELTSPAMGQVLAVPTPRHLRFAPLTAALIAALFLLPADWVGPVQLPTTPVGEEAERLAERLREVQDAAEGAVLPDPIAVGLEELSDDLNDELPPEEAIERIEDLQQKLDAFVDELEPSRSVLDELEAAAEELSSAPDLAEALRDADLDQAADALEDLAEQTGGMGSAEKQALGEQMQQAGEQLAGSGNPEMQKAGEQMQQAGEQLQQAGQNGESAAEAQERMQDLREQIARARELGERLQQDEKALERAQQTRGALEASKERLGGEGEVSEGTSSQEGETRDGESEQAGEGEGEGEGEGRSQASGPDGRQGNDGQESDGASSTANAHTWEDESAGAGKVDEQFNDEDRTSDRKATADQHIDDFERLYAGRRLDYVDPLLAGASGKLDEDGQIELVPTRRTGSDETSGVKLVDVPETYAEAAREAINDETVPPGYREAVKRYFDEME